MMQTTNLLQCAGRQRIRVTSVELVQSDSKGGACAGLHARQPDGRQHPASCFLHPAAKRGRATNGPGSPSRYPTSEGKSDLHSGNNAQGSMHGDLTANNILLQSVGGPPMDLEGAFEAAELDLSSSAASDAPDAAAFVAKVPQPGLGSRVCACGSRMSPVNAGSCEAAASCEAGGEQLAEPDGWCCCARKKTQKKVMLVAGARCTAAPQAALRGSAVSD